MGSTYWRVRVSGPGKDLRAFLSLHPNEPLVIQVDGDRVTIELLLEEGLLAAAKTFGTVERVYNASEVGRARQSQVGTGNRYKDGSIPAGLGLRR